MQILEDMTDNYSKIINWSELSRNVTKGDRNGIRFNKIPKKHIEALDKLFNEELPKWWVEHKSKLADKPEVGGQKIKTESTNE